MRNAGNDKISTKRNSDNLEQSLVSVLDNNGVQSQETNGQDSKSSDESVYESYTCHCCGNKCHDEKRDFLISEDEANDPPLIYLPVITSIESAESEVQFVAPKCHCANCALKNMCKLCSDLNNVGRGISKHFRYANLLF